MGWFMGSGYAIIQQLPNVTYPTLHHSITWQTAANIEEFCHATFPDMATWCRYCHAEGHTKFECPKALARIICYNCDKAGHCQDTCPKLKRGSSDREYKKALKTPPTTSSAEADKSQWAPHNLKNLDDSVQQPQVQQHQQHQQQQQEGQHGQQINSTLNDETTNATSPIEKPGSSTENLDGQIKRTDTQELQPMSEDESDDDDNECMPTASGSDSTSESEEDEDGMSDVDKVDNLLRDQQKHQAHINSHNYDEDYPIQIRFTQLQQSSESRPSTNTIIIPLPYSTSTV